MWTTQHKGHLLPSDRLKVVVRFSHGEKRTGGVWQQRDTYMWTVLATNTQRFHSTAEDSKERSSQDELLLDAPQGVGAAHQLLLLVGLQRHVDHIRQAAVAQDTGDAEEDLVLHAVHALMEGRKHGQRSGGREDTQRVFDERYR